MLSHWVLDLFVHYPDPPPCPGGSLKVGFFPRSMSVVSNLVVFAIFGIGLDSSDPVAAGAMGVLGG